MTSQIQPDICFDQTPEFRHVVTKYIFQLGYVKIFVSSTAWRLEQTRWVTAPSALPLAASLQGEEGSAQVTVWFSLSISGWVRGAASVLTILSNCSLLLSLSDLRSKTLSISWGSAVQLLVRSSLSTQLNLHLAGHKALLLLCPASWHNVY